MTERLITKLVLLAQYETLDSMKDHTTDKQTLEYIEECKKALREALHSL